jgi:hypothetical protein
MKLLIMKFSPTSHHFIPLQGGTGLNGVNLDRTRRRRSRREMN